MDESAQQAVSLGVNATIFVIALSVSITLLFNVRELADIALNASESTPSGAVTISTDNVDDRIISGYELISYYYNYITPYYSGEEDEYNYPNFGVVINTSKGTFKREIINGDIDNVKTRNDKLSLNQLKQKIDLNAMYTVNVKNHYDYDNTISGITVMYIEEIPEIKKSKMYRYYTNTVKNNFVSLDTNELFESSYLKIVVTEEDCETEYNINVNEDDKNENEEVRKVIASLKNSKYTVRIKRNNPTIGLKSSSIILYLKKAE